MIFFFLSSPCKEEETRLCFFQLGMDGWMGGGGGGTLRNTQACEGAMRRSEAYISAPPFSKSLEAHSKVTRR